MKPSVSVESPATNNPRKGRGFSKDELAAIKWNVKQAREAGLIVDERRKSKYKENIATLKVFKEDYIKVLADREKVLLKARKDGVKARREAKKRKQIEDSELVEREKEIDEERKRIAAAGRERCLKSGYSNHERLADMLRTVAEIRKNAG